MSDDVSRTPDDDLDQLLGELADRYQVQLTEDQQPDVEAYAAVDPKITELVRQVFPLLGIVRLALTERRLSDG